MTQRKVSDPMRGSTHAKGERDIKGSTIKLTQRVRDNETQRVNPRFSLGDFVEYRLITKDEHAPTILAISRRVPNTTNKGTFIQINRFLSI
jgi:hypothetical protein